jgi:hypothetical protein
MKNLSDFRHKAENFWGLEESERNTLVLQIQEYSNSKNESEFIREVRSTFQQIKYSGISVVYEALTENPKKWRQFFIEEYERAFKTAENSEKAFSILECLEQISFVEESKVDFQDEMVEILFRYLSHQNDVLRFKAVWLIGDWLTDENIRKYPDVIPSLEEKLDDNHWKIRYITKEVLEELGRLPSDFSLSFTDKLRAKTSNPYEME